MNLQWTSARGTIEITLRLRNTVECGCLDYHYFTLFLKLLFLSNGHDIIKFNTSLYRLLLKFLKIIFNNSILLLVRWQKGNSIIIRTQYIG